MTTSTNEAGNTLQKKGGLTKAASATLAGVLAVGMVPAVALAETTDDVQADEGISALIGTAAQAFSNGAVATAVWTGQAVPAAPTAGGISIQQTTGNAITVTPVTVTPAAGSTVTVYDTTNNKPVNGYTFEYFAADKDGKPTGSAISSVVNPGKYCTVVTATAGDYAGGSIALPFTVTAQSLGTLTVAEKNADGTTDTYYMYTGKALNLVGTCSGTGLEAGKDYTVKFLKAGSNQNAAGISVVEAGTYYAVATGLGIYSDQEVVSTNFTVAPFSLADADVTVDMTTSSTAPTQPTKVIMNASAPTSGATDLRPYNGTELDPSLVSLALAGSPASPAPLWGANKQYAVTASPKDATNTNITGTKAATVTKVGALATFNYNTSAMADVTINAGNGDAAYDTTKISAWNGATELPDSSADSADPTFDPASMVTVTKSTALEGASAAADLAANKAGTYTVTAAVAPGTGFTVGGQKTITVTVKTATINANATAYVTYNDGTTTTPVNSKSLPFKSGGYALAAVGNPPSANEFGTSVKLSNGTPVTSGFTFTATDADGNAVATPTNPGTYTLTIASDTYEFTGSTTVTLTITKLDLADLKVVKSSGDAVSFIDTTSAVSDFTGYKVQYNTGAKDASGNDVYADVPSGLTPTWQVQAADGTWSDVSSSPAIAANGIGVYRAVIAPNATYTTDVATYQSDDGSTAEINAMPAALADKFKDVPADAWYATPVAKAAQNEYINGYEGQDLFVPNGQITRGQVACVLYNMGGSGTVLDVEDQIDATGYRSFADVDPHMYYAKAIAWAKLTGVVNGFAGTNNFGPDQTVTREQFACMLWNYAKAVNSSTVNGVTDEAMNKLADSGSVSDWAKNGVAWAVQNKIMGNGGAINPLSNVTRAEAAAMAVNFQPVAPTRP